MLDDFGSLSVRAYTAGGALPIADASVTITGAEEDNRDIVYILFTDNDGVTESVKLPAPSREYSQSPNPSQAPYAVYDIEISADGYLGKRITGVPVFAGVYSIQPIAMIPHTIGMADIPTKNIDSVIPNSKLNN